MQVTRVSINLSGVPMIVSFSFFKRNIIDITRNLIYIVIIRIANFFINIYFENVLAETRTTEEETIF